MPKHLPPPPLYFVTDHALTAGRRQPEVVEAALRGGVKWVQYRDKELDDAAFTAEARAVLDACRRHGAALLINDRVAVAKAIGADGVHLGQDDMDPRAARELLGDGAIIGLSTHTAEEVESARALPLDYINIGPMFPTGTKDHSAYGALGLERVAALAAASPFPVTTMGGIKRHHLRGIAAAGLRTVAMVTEISLAENVEERTRALVAELATLGLP